MSNSITSGGEITFKFKVQARKRNRVSNKGLESRLVHTHPSHNRQQMLFLTH